MKLHIEFRPSELMAQHAIFRPPAETFCDSATGALQGANTLLSDEYDYFRHYAFRWLSHPEPQLRATNCSPPTPVAELVGYRQEAERHGATISNIVRGITQRDLRMGTFARAANAYVQFVQSLPDEFCIGDSNRDAYDAMVAAIQNTSGIVNNGVSRFEDYFGRFMNGADPLLREVASDSNQIDSSSRDFRPVVDVVTRWQDYLDDYQLEIWNLSPTIEAFANRYANLLNAADTAFSRALNQIQSNVEAEARRFVAALDTCQAAYRHWDTQDGAEGFDRYVFTLRYVSNDLIPPFNEFLSKVPSTDRIRRALNQAQQALDQMSTIFDSFPDFSPLPASTTTHPYNSYWTRDRRYGNAAIIEVVRRACRAHYQDTNNKLYVGDMSYRHGGRARPHSSHREGIDADIDPVEVGNVGDANYNEALALAAAKRFLQAGARIVFYANTQVVNDANQWAQQQGLAGRLQYEADHTNHFHLRV